MRANLIQPILVLLVCGMIAYGEQLTPYERLLDAMDKYPQSLKGGYWGPVEQWLSTLCQDTVAPPPDSARWVFWSLAIDSTVNDDARELAVSALHWFNDKQMHDSLRRMYASGEHQQRIACLFLRWGMWDEGAPYLAEHTGYDILAYYDSAKARPIIEAALADPSPRERAYAASAMSQYYGDDSHERRIALENIQQYDHHHVDWTDETETLKLLDGAYKSLIRLLSNDDVWVYEKGAESRFSLIRGDAIRGLARLSASGNEQAKHCLTRLKETSKFNDVRERCRMVLDQ